MNGFILIDKPSGISSFQALQQLNRRFRIQDRYGRLGHGGTLDPEASGLLVVAIGRATKLLRFFLGSDKRYTAEITFGARTNTDDAEGEVIAEAPFNHISRSDVAQAIERFKGRIQQIPPLFSAIHINGKRAYKLARKGKEIEMPPREVEVYDIRILDCGLPEKPTLTLDIACSGGTYIRTIAHDLGIALGSEAYLASLRRTESCHFNVKNAMPLDQFEHLQSLESCMHTNVEAMSGFTAIRPSKKNIIRLLRGLPVNFNISLDGIYTIITPDDQLVAVVERREGKNDYLRLTTPEELYPQTPET